MKLLIDMNLSPRWVDRLNKAGFEAVHWSTTGKSDATDFEIMGFAAAHDFIVVTHDLDFGEILAVTHGRKPSVVQIRSENVAIDMIGKKVVGALVQMQEQLEAGALLTIDTNRSRIRLLPLDAEGK